MASLSAYNLPESLTVAMGATTIAKTNSGNEMTARRGRPPTGTIHGKSSVFTTRIRPDLRERLDEAAAKAGHSLSQEVERRLTDSFIQDRRIEDIFGTAEEFWLMRVIAIAMQVKYVPFQGNSEWKNSPEHFDLMIRTVNGVLESMRPAAPLKLSPIEEQMNDFASKNLPIAIWQAITEADESLPLDQGSNDDHLAAMLKRKIGKVAETALQNAREVMPSDEEWKRRKEAAYAEQHKAMSETGKRRKK